MHGPIVGRQAELELIETLLSEAADGPRGILLEGAPGIGKSVLLTEALAGARARGITVLEASPSGGEVELAYAGIADLLGRALEAVDRLPTPQRKALRVALLLDEPGRVPPDERAVASALLGVLSALSHDVVLVVAVDDLQWLDAASMRALAFALRRVRDERIAFLATVRDEWSSRHLEEMGGERIVRHVIGPLTVASIFTLIESRLGTTLPRPAVVRLHEVAGGNPLFALELARAVIERGETFSAADPIPVSTELRDLFNERLGRLSPAANDALAAAASLARPTVTLVCAAEGSAASDALDEAVEAGAIRYHGDRVRFTHPLIATIEYERTSPVKRRDLHRRLAAVVPEGEERAHHLARSVVGPDARIAAELDRAAAAAGARGAPVAAAALAEQALALTPADDGERRHARRLEAARHAFIAGDSARARDLLESAIADAAGGPLRAEALGALARIELRAENVIEALAHFDAAVQEVGLDSRLRASLYEGLAHAAAIRSSLDLAVSYAREAVALVGEDDAALRAECLGMLARVEYNLGKGQTAGVLEEAVELERRSVTLAFDASPSSLLAQTLLEAGDVEGARSVLEDLCARARDASDASVSVPLAELSRLELGAGRLDLAEALARESHEVAVLAARDLAQAPGLVRLGDVLLARGQLDDARELAARALELTQRTGRASRDPNALLGAVELAAERYEEACTYLRRCNDKHAELGSVLPTDATMHGIAAFAALSRLDDAHELLAMIVDYAERFGRPYDHALADYCRGLIASAAGDLESAVTTFERSLAVPLQPLVEGQRLIQLGAVQRRVRRKRDARRTLLAALDVLEPIGAELWAAKARTELGRIGGRASAQEGLSATERRIVELVSEGRTTREVAAEMFVSAKTVEWNLTRIYRKLGVRSRTELAARRDL
jgi:DNA-binding CsgD family transcriptional regulator